MTIANVIDFLENLAPLPYQESYDNPGLLTGDLQAPVTGILTTLDCTEEVVEEAIQQKSNLIVAHHPIIFKGLKKITGSNYVERTVLKAIRNNIAIYAIHTNLDNIHTGVNRKICEKIGLKNIRLMAPKKNTLSKLVTFVPQDHTDRVLVALHEAGAGQIGNYGNCSFRVVGTGTFKPLDGSAPFVGALGQQESVQEDRVEVIFPTHLENVVLQSLRKAHPYEEVAYYINSLTNENQDVGAGMVGELESPAEPIEFLQRLKTNMSLSVIRHTALPNKKIQKIAVCGGSGSFLLSQAIRQKADIFVTADYKYHEFFDADKQIIIADIGHYESEAFTKDLLKDILTKKFPNFAVNFSITNTNPISYLH
jgi:dinuclear metal center YbgI/SA1388 family protein